MTEHEELPEPPAPSNEAQADRRARESGPAELLTQSLPQLRRHLLKHGAPLDTVDDLVAETVLAIWQNLGSYDSNLGPFLPWAYRIADNKLIDYWRKTKHSEKITSIESETAEETSLDERLAGDEDLEAEFALKESERRLLELIVELPEVDRLLFFLKVNYDLKYEDLATILNNSELGKEQRFTAAMLAQKYSRLRKKLKELVSE